MAISQRSSPTLAVCHSASGITGAARVDAGTHGVPQVVDEPLAGALAVQQQGRRLAAGAVVGGQQRGDALALVRGARRV
jgi:hypothetical protein